MRQKTCKQCAKKFDPINPLVPYCSPRCQKAKESEKKKEKLGKAKEKKAKSREKKRLSPKSLALKLDFLFSKYVRLRDSIRTTGNHEMAVCVTSGELVSGKNLNCGHFMSRRHKLISWCEVNAHGQSAKDNCYGAGEQYKHGKMVDKLHGEGVADWLMQESARTFKLTADSMIWVDYKVAMTPVEAISHYEKKISELEKSRN